jgi:hypothetical protein
MPKIYGCFAFQNALQAFYALSVRAPLNTLPNSLEAFPSLQWARQIGKTLLPIHANRQRCGNVKAIPGKLASLSWLLGNTDCNENWYDLFSSMKRVRIIYFDPRNFRVMESLDQWESTLVPCVVWVVGHKWNQGWRLWNVSCCLMT